MNSEATPQNAWVDSYLNALLTYGLSSEYTATTKASQSKNAPDADRSAYSRFYVQSLLNLNEESLSAAYFKAASAGKAGNDKDARLGYLSWRIWFLKRRHAAVDAERRAVAELAEEDSHPPTEYSSDEEAAAAAAAAARGAARRPSASGARLSAVPEASGEAGGVGGVGTKKTRRVKIGSTESSGSPLVSPTALPHAGSGVAAAAAALASGSAFDDYAAAAAGEGPGAEGSYSAGEAPRGDSLYIVMISLHGLVRGEHMELGKDSDTGGQVKYVVELARSMALHPAVHRVDLLTRLIRDPGVEPEYGVEEECLARGTGETGGAYIVRLPCGPPEKYIRKELLWPHVREFADRGVAHVARALAACSEDGHRAQLYVVHGHYADAGEVAMLMSCSLGVPMLVTGHSLGRNKLEHLLKGGAMTRRQIEEAYAVSRRIEAEERALDAALMVFTSTQQEIDEQWGLYDGYSPSLSRVLHFRRSFGRHMPLLKVSPPGLDFSNLKVDIPEDPVVKEFAAARAAFAELSLHGAGGSSAAAEASALSAASAASGVSSTSSAPGSPLGSPHPGGHHGRSAGGAHALDPRVALIPEGPRIWQDIARFLRNPLKPAVLAMSRPDPKKNLTTLVKAFGESPMLRELSNLVLIMGNRDAIDSMAAGSQKVLVQVLKLIDYYDLHGSVAYPKHHSQAEISDIYSFATATRGVFTNIALQEPFGLTVIEAAAHGAPTVATANGGPVDIMATLHHGVTVDPTDAGATSDALLNILTSPATWDAMSASGVANIMAYSWPSHCKRYIEAVDAELRFLRSYRRHDRTMSGLLDARKPARVADLLGASDRAASAAPGLIARRSIGAPGSHAGLEHAADAYLVVGKPGADASLPDPSSPVPPRRGASGISADDLALLSSINADSLAASSAGAPAGAGRARAFVLALDSEGDVPRVASLLQGLMGSADATSPRREGFALLSMLGFEATCGALRGAGVGVEALDFVVCNAGADAWFRTASDGWEVDEAYQSLIEFEWDRTSLHRTLKKVVSRREATATSLPRLKELLYDVVEAPSTGVHPRHICMELDTETQAILTIGMGPQARAAHGGRLSNVCMQRLRRRLRSKGLRASYTLQMLPCQEAEQVSGKALGQGEGEAGPDASAAPDKEKASHVAVLHITPLRASRALALRALCRQMGYSLDAVTLLLPLVASKGEAPGLRGAAHTNDLLDLAAGMQRVVLLAPPAPGTDPAADELLLSQCGVDLSPWMSYGDRVTLMPDADVPAALAGKD